MSKNENESYFGKDLEAMSFAENYHNWILDEFRPYLSGVVAEVGAGSGNFSSMLLSTGISELKAFEPSSNMFQYLVERIGEDARSAAVNKYFFEEYKKYVGYFDAVVYVNVLEHIERDHDELCMVHESLKNGGKLCVFVPALSWLYSHLDEEVGHFRRYHKNQLVELVENAGFSVFKVKYFDILGVIPWYFAFVLLKKSISGGQVSVYDKWIVPIMRRVESIISPPLGKNLLLVAGKK